MFAVWPTTSARYLELEHFLADLRREEAGAFGLNQAHSLVEIEQMATSGRFADLLLPSGTGLGLPRITLTTEQATRFGYGQTVILAGSDVQDAEAQTEEISGDSTAWNTDLIAQGL